MVPPEVMVPVKLPLVAARLQRKLALPSALLLTAGRMAPVRVVLAAVASVVAVNVPLVEPFSPKTPDVPDTPRSNSDAPLVVIPVETLVSLVPAPSTTALAVRE